MRSLLLILILFAAISAEGEYRAYRLRIVNTVLGSEREVKSTLDHIQYPGYYPLNRNEVVEYVESWRCRGRTGHFRRICPQPEASTATNVAPQTPSL